MLVSLFLFAGAQAPLHLASAAPHGHNPFANTAFYVNGEYQNRVRESMRARWSEGHTHEEMSNMLSVPSAVWIDRIAKIRRWTAGLGPSLESTLADAASKSSPPPLVVVILYDLPNRDCHAHASNGEVCCEYNPDGKTCNYDTRDSTCNVGLTKYKHEYVDPFVNMLSTFSSVPVAVIIEPDSLPNVATNLAEPRCGNPATVRAYTDGIAYALERLHARAPHATLYMDAGHGGWLGWPAEADKFARVIKGLGDGTVYRLLRGFATNVANYQALGAPCPAEAFRDVDAQSLGTWCAKSAGEHARCCADPCGLLSQFNSANNEHNYVQLLRSRIARVAPDFEPRFIIDTGRNGASESAIRQDCRNWCNIRGAGLGRESTPATELPGLVDAYFWLKTPGESDGCTETLPDGSSCPRFDTMCASVDSIGSEPGEPRAPEAGGWFVPQLAELSCHGAIKGGSGGGGCGGVLRAAEAERQVPTFAAAPSPLHGYSWGDEPGDQSNRVIMGSRGSTSWPASHAQSEPVGGSSPSGSRMFLAVVTTCGLAGCLTWPRWRSMAQSHARRRLGDER